MINYSDEQNFERNFPEFFTELDRELERMETAQKPKEWYQEIYRIDGQLTAYQKIKEYLKEASSDADFLKNVLDFVEKELDKLDERFYNW